MASTRPAWSRDLENSRGHPHAPQVDVPAYEFAARMVFRKKAEGKEKDSIGRHCSVFLS